MLQKMVNAAVLLLFFLNSHAQTPFQDIDSWIGSGSKEAVLVIDFNDALPQECWAFGYKFDDTPTLHQMLQTIELEYPWITFTLDGGFLNGIGLGNHLQLSANPFYWMTFTQGSDSSWAYNDGLPTIIEDGKVYGCTYSDVDSLWNPLFYPENPRQALKLFTADSLSQWVGAGADYAMLVVDFNDGNASESFAWGYRFNGSCTASEMILAIQAADPAFSVNLDFGFLNDVLYGSHAGLAGNPEYWSTFSGRNPYDWDFNSGIVTTLISGDWFGCSYTPYDTSWNPVFYPENPVAAVWINSISKPSQQNISVYPNPAANRLYLESEKPTASFIIRNFLGDVVLTGDLSDSKSIDIESLSPGAYVLGLTDSEVYFTQSFIKQ